MSKVRQAGRAAARADRKATHRAAAKRDHLAVRTLGTLSEAADQPPLRALTLATAAAGVVLRRPRLVHAGLTMLASHTLATSIKSRIKHMVDRTRPETALATGRHRFARGHSHDSQLSSFPSGHTAGAIAVSAALARDFPKAALPAYAATAAVAAIQLPRGKHYLSDVLAGAAIGAVAAWATAKGETWLRPRA